MSEFPESSAKVPTGFVGRIEFFEEIRKWLNETNQRCFLLTGEPGIGKTAFAAQLSQDQRFPVRASHYCIAGSGSTVNPGIAIQAISSQLRRALPGFEQEYTSSATERRITLNVNLAIDTMLGGEAVGARIGTVNAINFQDEFESAIRSPLSKVQGISDPIVIVIDGLDEAMSFQGPVNLVTLIANANDVPSWVRFLCTSRPDNRVLRFFSPDNTRVLAAETPSNLQDLRGFIYARLQRAASLGNPEKRTIDELAEKVANAAKGSFLVGTLLLDDIEAGRLSDRDISESPSGIDDVYRRFLSRLDYPAWTDSYQPLCEILVAAQEPLTAQAMAEVLETSDTKLRNTLSVFQQFLRRSAEAVPHRYSLFHQTFRDYLSSEERAGSFFCSQTSGDWSISKHYLAKWQLEGDSMNVYELTYLPLHLARSRQYSKLKTLLTSFDWLQIKLRTLGLRPLLQDLMLLKDDSDLNLIHTALLQSSKVLLNRPAELGAQLSGRLFANKSPAIGDLIQQISAKHSKPWLRLLSPTVTQAGEPLLSTAVIEGTGYGGPPLIAISPDCTKLVLSAPNAPLRVMDLDSGVPLLKSEHGDRGAPFVLRVGKTGDYAVTVSAPMLYRGQLGKFSVTVWSLINGTARTLPEVGDRVAVDINAEFAAISAGSKCRIWNLNQMECIKDIYLSGDTIAAVGPEARLLLVTSGRDKMAIIDVLDERRHIFSISDPVDSAFITPDSRSLILIRSNGVEIRDSLNTEITSLFELKAGFNAVSPDGLAIASASDGRLRVFDIKSGAEVNNIEFHVPGLERLELSTRAKRVVSATMKQIRVWDPSRAENKKQLPVGTIGRPAPHRTGFCGCFSMSQDAIHAAAVLHDGSICVVDVLQREVRKILTPSSPATCVHIHSESGTMVFGCQNGTLVIWDLSTLQPIETVQGSGEPWCFVFLGLSAERVYAVRYGQIRSWSLSEVRVPSRLTLINPSVQDSAFFAAFSSNGSRAITAAYNVISLWNLDSNRQIAQWDCGLVHAMACTDKIGAISKDRSPSMSSEGQCVEIWDLKTQKSLFSVDAHASCLAFSLDGSFLLIGGDTLTVLNMASRKAVGVFTPDSPIAGCAMSRDNITIVALDSTSQLHFFELVL